VVGEQTSLRICTKWGRINKGGTKDDVSREKLKKHKEKQLRSRELGVVGGGGGGIEGEFRESLVGYKKGPKVPTWGQETQLMKG